MRLTSGALTLLLWFVTVSTAQETLIMPPRAEALAKAHHCQLVYDYIASPEALMNPPFDMRRGKDGTARMVATWCTNDRPTARARSYTLLLSLKDQSNPLHACPDEIRHLRHVGTIVSRDQRAH